MKYLYDRLDNADKKDFNKSKKAILEALDMDPSEYLSEFNSTKKKPNETHTCFAIRIIRLYLKGHAEGSSYNLIERDQKTLVQQFLTGINQQIQIVSDW